MTPLPSHFSFTDTRTGDTYNVDLDDDGEFLFATRFMERVGGSSVPYAALADLPPAHRAMIEGFIAKRRVGR